MTNKSRLVSGRVPVSNSANVTSDRYQFLDLGSAEPNLGTANVGEVLVYDTSGPGSRKWIPQSNITGSGFAQANTALVLAQAAYNQANVTIGVDTSQNARMVIIENTDLSQNVRLNYSNAAITIIQGTDTSQNVRLDYSNTRMTVSDGVNASQNTRLDYSNTAITIIQGTNVTQNTRLTVIEGTNASQNSRMTVIEGTDVSQNTRIDYSNVAITIIQGVDLTQNAATAATNQYATSAFSTANNAYTKANNALANTTGTFAGTLTVTGNVIANSFQTAGSSGNISGANFVYANTFVSSNAYIFSDGTVQTTGAVSAPFSISSYNQANTGTVLAQAAYNQANVTIGVDATQNTRLTVIEGTDVSQNTRIDYSNAAITIIQGVDVTQNTNIAATDGKMQSAYNQANTGTVLAQASYNQANVTIGVDATQNTRLTVIEGTDVSQNARMAIIEATDVSQNVRLDYSNSAITILQGVDAGQNTLIQTVYNTANVGKNFVTQGGTVSGNVSILGNLNVTGNISVIGNVTNLVITGNSGQFFGNNTTGFEALYAGIAVGYDFQPQTVLQTSGNFNGYSQINNQNINPGANASSDIVATADNGNEGDTFIDMGINSSNYSQPEFSLTGPNDGYLYVHGNTSTGGGNLIFSTMHQNDIIFSINGVTTANEVARFKFDEGLILKNYPLTFTDATKQNTAASPVNYTQASFDKANSASSNTIVTQGVDLTQNTAIAATDGKMQSAYNQANVTIGVDATQNTRLTVIENTDLSQNVRIDYSNTAITIIQGTDVSQNARMTIIEDTDVSQNVSINTQNSFITIIQGVDVSQNARMAIIEGVDLSQNTAISATDGKMQSAYNQANTGTVLAQAGYNQSNASFLGVNTAITIIQGTDVSQNARMVIIENTDVSQNARMVIADGVDVSQNVRIDYSNTAITILQGVDLGQNTAIAATDGKMQSAYNQANTGTVLAQAAYIQANVTIGVDATQNTRLTVIENTDLSQNSRIDYSNAAITIIQGTDVSQNSRMVIIEGVDVWQNNSIIALQSSLITINSNSAYSSAIDNSQNSRMTIIEGTDLSQNSRIDYSNTAIIILQGVDLTQNTNIAATDGKMQSSYNQANTGTVLAQAAFDKANTENGYLANSIFFANNTGYRSNTNNLQFFTSNNTLVAANISVPRIYTTSGGISFPDGSVQTTASSGGGGSGITYTRQTTNSSINNGQGIIADTSAGPFTITLPSGPVVSNQVVIVDGNNFAANNVTVVRNGSTIEGIAEDLILDIQGVSVTLIYDNSTWQVYTQVGAQGGTANNFGTILVAGQSNVVAGTLGAPVTFVAGTNATITTDAVNKTVTFNSLVPTTNYLIKTSGYTAASGDKVFCDTTSSAFTITLPASPSAGNYVTISSGPYVALNKLTVGRNSSTIMGLSEDMDITVNNTSIDFVYDGTTWRIA